MANLAQQSSFRTAPTNTSDESNSTTFDNRLSFFAGNIPKLNVLIIGGDMNLQIGKNENNKFVLDNLPNRNDEYQIYLIPRE